ncbi:MAG: response regulator transcription factor [Elusimicrobia bacterium]|nr:response regulator transcription factor [Elusimicrobiota bacterium]
MGQKTVLVVEDDPLHRGVIEAALQVKGYRVLATDRVDGAWHLFLSQSPDLAILDVNLPDGTGVDLCQKIRAHKERWPTPVIMLTGRGELQNKAEGFQAGADQYLVKPVSPEEVMMWVEALLRRLSFDQDERGRVLKVGELEIDADAHLIRYRGTAMGGLTVKEFDLLSFLVQKRPKVLTRKYILDHLWHTITVDQVVDTHLSNLRRKLPRELADRIQTIPGKGFRFME